MATVVQKKDYSTVCFWVLTSILLGGLALYSYAFNQQVKETKAKFALEQQAIAYSIEALELKETLEECSLNSSDKNIKVESFNMILAHVIEKNVSHDTLRKQITACKKTLNT